MTCVKRYRDKDYANRDNNRDKKGIKKHSSNMTIEELFINKKMCMKLFQFKKKNSP